MQVRRAPAARIGRQALRLIVNMAAVAFGVGVYGYVTLPDVRPLARTNPGATAFMALRAREAADAGTPVRQLQRWVPYSRISSHLKRAVLVAEDDAFFQHEGIDLQQIRRSIQVDLVQGKALRGASTITQQLAKNLYLSPSRNPLRKVKELLITRRLEAELSKARIFEIYLNVIEWGDGVWGAEAAARTYFHTSASALSREQASLLAASIINPREMNPRRSSARLERRQRMILSRLGSVSPPLDIPKSSLVTIEAEVDGSAAAAIESDANRPAATPDELTPNANLSPLTSP